MAANRSLLEQVLPQYDVNEVHSIMVHASPEAVYRAIRSISMSDLTIGRILFWLRRLPAMLIAPGRAVIGQQSSRQPFLEALSHAGFVQVAETPNEEIVIGLVGKFWQPVQNQVKLDDGEAFRRFDDPSYAKAVINFQIASVSEGDVRVTTETRVRVQDPAGRLLFRMYWALIGLFSGLIRIEMLRQIKRTAEGGYNVR
jgi:hypothetical protein